MNQGVVASLPLGLVAIILIGLVGLGGVAGLLWVRRTTPRPTSRAASTEANRIAGIIQTLPQAALLIDANARIVAGNTAAIQFLGLFGRQTDLPLAVDAAVGRVTRSGTAETLELTTPGREQKRLQISVLPLSIEGGVSEALVMITDPAGQGERADVYRRLTSLIAHELRTPLTSLMGHVEILGSSRIDEEALWRRSLGFVSGEVERLARLVEDLLSLTRLDQIPLNIQATNLRLAAEEALSAYYNTAEKHGAALVLQCPTELPRVKADSDRIRQVFLNLVDNAIKYAPGGSITIRLTPEASSVRVEVADNGPGIPADDLPHIFEPLYRSKGAPAGARGSGLGLTIVRTIIEQHRAQITVRSSPETGTAFSFSLPLLQPADTKPRWQNSDARATQ